MAPGCGRQRRRKIAVQADHSLKVGAGTRELEHIAAAEAEADRRLPLEVADAALVAFAAQRIERGGDAAAPLGRIRAYRIGECR